MSESTTFRSDVQNSAAARHAEACHLFPERNGTQPAARNGHSSDAAREQTIRFWRERLSGLPPALDLPTDRPRSASREFRASRHTLHFSQSLIESLESLGTREGATLSDTFLAGFSALLARYTGQLDLAVGVIVPGRVEPEAHSLIGCLANAVPIRTSLTDDPSFRELLSRVKEETHAAAEHHGVLFSRIADELQRSGDFNPHSLSQVLFSVTPFPSLSRYGEEIGDFEPESSAVPADLHLHISHAPAGTLAHLIFDATLFDAPTVARIAGHLETLLQGAAGNPDCVVSRLPLLTNAERRRQLLEWNDTKTDYPKTLCVHQLFEIQAKQTPDTIALAFGGEQLSYDELNRRANRIARYLLKLGVKPDALVGICVERCPDMVAGLLGILKAGGAYVPLDPLYPPERLSSMLQDSEAKVLVTQISFANRFSGFAGELVFLDSEALDKEDVENCPCATKPENLAYVIYTSGSTGKPKGVQIPHRALVNFLSAMRSEPGLTAEDSLLAVTTISFDIAALELFLPLTVGARLVLLTREIAADGTKLKETLEQVSPTTMQATPATWRLLLEAGWKGAPNLKILCGGEALPRELAAELLPRCASLWNMYGPTETTVWSTTSRIVSHEAPITIGKPIANTDTYVLDSHLEPVPIGVSGDLYIGGDGIANGYLHRPELTSEKFIPHPFRASGSHERLYRTGDVARYRVNGELECLGRTDNQVKVRGFRIELGEIESVLSEFEAVRQNVVIAREDTPGDKRIVAYLVPAPGRSLVPQELREFLKKRLPEYMVPSTFVSLQSLPLTPNGKVDRLALPKPKEVDSHRQDQISTSARGDIETQLTQIWQSVLGSSGIGLNENFFELGGHSLLVAKLLARIKQTFGKQLSMAAIFEAPTIEQQASMLRNGDDRRRLSAIVPIQPAGSKPPFFCCGFNAGPVFLPLARRLGLDQPFFGIDPTLLRASDLAAPITTESIAATLVKQIRECQPEGPYFLGGFCGGGLMAYETARQLLGQGQRVGLLALVEPQVVADYSSQPKSDSVRSFARRIVFHLRNLQHFTSREGRTFTLYRASVFLNGVKRSLSRRGNIEAARGNPFKNIVDLAYRAYRPQPFAGRITLFEATTRPSERKDDRKFWSDLSASVDVLTIPGDWNWAVRFFLEPEVATLAKEITHRLN